VTGCGSFRHDAGQGGRLLFASCPKRDAWLGQSRWRGVGVEVQRWQTGVEMNRATRAASAEGRAGRGRPCPYAGCPGGCGDASW
jgi:hypothetical protein